MLHIISRMSNKYGGAQQAACITLARAVALGRLLYGAPVYTLSNSHKKQLAVLHRATLRTITGLPRHTRIDALEKAAPLPPVEALLSEAALQHEQRRSLTGQGAALAAWDARTMLPPPLSPAPPAPWERPLLTSPHQRPGIPKARRCHRQKALCRILGAKLPDETDIFTDASLDHHRMGLAWHCPARPEFDGSTTKHILYPSPTEAELRGILHSLDHLAYNVSAPLPARIRILTDSKNAIDEFNKAFSDHPTVHQIQAMVNILAQNGTKTRLAWIPGHMMQGHGNQTAHSAARESLLVTPPLDDQSPAAVSPTSFRLQLDHARHARRCRLASSTPLGYLHGVPSLPRPAEIFINKTLANAAVTPHIIYKWIHPGTSLPSRCPHCSATSIADLNHLIWHCTAFSDHRYIIENALPNGSSPANPPYHDPQFLAALGTFSLESGLARVV